MTKPISKNCIRNLGYRRLELKLARNMLTLFDQEDALRRSTKAQMGQAEKEGIRKGENRMAQLMVKLYSLGCTTDAERASQDEEFRQELYREFGLSAS